MLLAEIWQLFGVNQLAVRRKKIRAHFMQPDDAAGDEDMARYGDLGGLKT